ncbi:MAG: hypothetical protein CR997_12225 [Acidobacteria bacterium]|nr:MAG: hypothetical protein CR997_12225 [Acidobacteriota bacterium]
MRTWIPMKILTVWKMMRHHKTRSWSSLMSKKDSHQKSSWLRPAAIGPHFIVATLIGFYFGKKCDEWFQTDKICTIIGTAMGIAAGFVNLFKELALINKEELEAQSETKDDVQK